MGKQWKTAGKQEQASQKGALFTRLSRAIQSAVKTGGGADPENNARLRLALQTARSHSLPKDTIQRAIKRGLGNRAEESLESVLYEGFGPLGSVMLVECLTDNRVRTVSEIRGIFKNKGGRMGESGSVIWMFDHLSIVEAYPPLNENIEDVAIEVGADDIKIVDLPNEEENKLVILYADKNNMDHLQNLLIKKAWKIKTAGLGFRAKTPLAVSKQDAQTIRDFLQVFKDHPDCQQVYSNWWESN